MAPTGAETLCLSQGYDPDGIGAITRKKGMGFLGRVEPYGKGKNPFAKNFQLPGILAHIAPGEPPDRETTAYYGWTGT